MITDPDAFFAKGCGRCARFATPDCSVRVWHDGLVTLRRICLAAGLQEAAKWGHPCYMHAGRNIAIMGAFRGDFRLTFFNAALLADAGNLLEKQGENTRHADCLRFTDTAAPGAMEHAIRGLLAQAMAFAAQGILPPKDPRAVDPPDELVAALDNDPDLAMAFAALTPGRQKSWAFQIGTAKTAGTRLSRIARARPRILAGKGATER